MSEQTKKAPVIRFQGFTDDWEQRKLGEVIDNQYNGQTPSRANASFWNGEINWLSSGELNRGVVSETIEKITEDGRKNANLKIVPKGTFVMAITGLEAAGTRGNCAKLGIDTTMNQSCMALFPKKKLLDSSFLFQWYRKVGEEYGLQYTQGTKQQSYNAELLKILPIVLPSVSEQVLIADFFDKIDDTIALHQRMSDKQKKLKANLLQMMFPRNGEKIPEVRLAGFAEDWAQRTLEDISDKVTEKNKAREFTETLTNSAEYGIISQSDFFDKDISNINSIDGYYVVRPDDFVYNPRISNFAPVGPIKRNNLNRIGIMSPLYYVFRPKGVDHTFLEKYFETSYWHIFMKMNGDSGARADRFAIKDAILKEMPIPYPVKEEQVRIGIFFNQLDKSIALHQEKIAHLKTLKNTLLNKMFI